jgi:TMEM175 potassium channel family protein
LVLRTKATPERMSMFSDGVFAVLITVLVLELRPPAVPTYAALLDLWPRWLSYAVSYLFIAIVWANHHYLMRYASEATPRLLWFNFAHLFSMSLLPLSTAWMATSELAPQPVSFYASVFFVVNVTYVALIWELNPASDASPSDHLDLATDCRASDLYRVPRGLSEAGSERPVTNQQQMTAMGRFRS